jgi:hypothetical protein
MQLTIDDQWMLAYMNTRLHNWGDVTDGAARTIKKIENHDDFVAWTECFLPKSRLDETLKALRAFKTSRAKKQSATKATKQVAVNLEERAARLLIARARAEQCSVSEFLLKNLA